MSDMTKAKSGQYLTFNLQTEQYGLPIETVREINRVGEITPVPKTPEFVKGVMNLRGKIIPVINLRTRFGMPAQGYTRDTCIIVIESQIGQVGLIVDSVKEVVTFEENMIEPAPTLGSQHSMMFLKGMGKLEDRVVILVDIAESFTPEQLGEIMQISQDNNQKAA